MINNLQELYKTDFSCLPETVIRDLEATEEVQQLRRDIKDKISAGSWQKARSVLLQELQKLLDIKLQPILIESWKTHQDVEREIKAQQDSGSSELAIVTLQDHEIRSTHYPTLTVQLTGGIVHSLRCFIGITLLLKDVSLIIQQGEIREALSGTASGHGFIQYQNATLVEKDFLNFDISGAYTEPEPASPNAPDPVDVSEKVLPDKPQTLEPEMSASQIASSGKAESKGLSSNMIQFIIGISIALIAVYLFWQFK